MLSSATSTAPSVIPNPSSSPPLLPSCSPPPTSTSLLQLVDISVPSTPVKNVKPASPYSSPPPMVTTSKTPNSKCSVSPLSKAMSPPVSKPICPPLPEHQPSSVPKGSSTAMSKAPPWPSSKPLSPPLRRPPARPVSKITITSADQAQKPTSPSISILEKLIKTCPVWLQLGMTGERAIRVLKKESPGIFLVRRETGQKLMVLSVRLPDQQGEPQVQELHVKEDRALLYLDGSVLVFDNIFKLVAFYCISRDILPFTLKLPQAILKANKYEDMEVISSLGLEFWSSSLNSHNQDHLNKSSEHSNSSELSQLSTGHLWYINPIFIEEYHNSLPPTSPPPVLRSQSLNIPVLAFPKFKKPPPLPPRPFTVPEHSAKEAREELASEESSLLLLSSPPPVGQKEEGNQRTERERTPESNAKTGAVKSDVEKQALTEAIKHASHGPVVINRITPSENQLSEVQILQSSSMQATSFSAVDLEDKTKVKEPVPVASLESIICLDDSSMAQWGSPAGSPGQPKSLQEASLEDWSKVSNGALTESKLSSVDTKKPGTPVPPPRKKRTSQIVSTNSQYGISAPEGATQQLSGPNPQSSRMPDSMLHKLKVPDVSLFAPEGGSPQAEHDSNSTSSMEEEVDPTPLGTSVKRKPTIMLDIAKQRLSMVNFSTVFTSFMNTDSKLQKRIVELARDGGTYFGNLVQDYRAFTLDTMKRHSSSTEMLQEIRQMMTQLKSYLIQSTELQSLQETNSYSEDKLEIIIEAAICKSVLKPLREAIYNSLKDIHSHAGTLKKLKEHQQIVLGTTTTDLGVKTCVPDSPVIEKIQLKMGQMHQEYSPQKKIDLLLKTCKIIYDSMSVGCPGKAHGADDFLPVLMYVLARCNMTALLLDVEYMMELMDPVLQLGEGSYYLTTTYGALEHIKNYDKQTVSRQLSLEIQDSIHQWERRRTLNKARASRSSVQDFINVSFMEACANTKTLGVHPSTTALELCAQCAQKFEVLEPDSYCLCVLVDGEYRTLSPDEFPLTIKSSLHHSEPRKEYFFVYRHGRWAEKKPDENTQSASKPTAAQEDSLI